MYLQFLFIGVYFGYSMGIAPLLGYAYGNNDLAVCKKLELYSHRFFAFAPILMYALTYISAPPAVSLLHQKQRFIFWLYPECGCMESDIFFRDLTYSLQFD